MDANTAWLAVGVLSIVVGVLAVSVIRLRLELWANRRVIAALEQTAPKTTRTAKSNWFVLLLWIGLGLFFAQVVVILQLF
jgi:hypothetical protein